MRISMLSSPGGGATVVRVEGQLDIDSRGMLESTLAALFDRSACRLVIDLSGLTFCDSTGLSAFVVAHRRCVAAGGYLRLAAPTPFLLRVLDVVGVRAAVPVYPSVSAAVSGELAPTR